MAQSNTCFIMGLCAQSILSRSSSMLPVGRRLRIVVPIIAPNFALAHRIAMPISSEEPPDR